MKTTYLIYKQVDGTRQLVVATQEEWDAILKRNKGLPPEKRRFFIKDCFNDGSELDCMYIEASRDDYRKWHNNIRTAQRNMKSAAMNPSLSLDAEIPSSDVSSLHECVDSGLNLEEVAVNRILFEELKVALKAWKPWALELLSLYMEGRGRTCTMELCEKYHVTDRAIQKRKIAFEKFVENFLKK